METINKGQTWPLYEQPMLMLKAMWTGEVAPFGCGYTCAIGDTVTAGTAPGPCQHRMLQQQELSHSSGLDSMRCST